MFATARRTIPRIAATPPSLSSFASISLHPFPASGEAVRVVDADARGGEGVEEPCPPPSWLPWGRSGGVRETAAGHGGAPPGPGLAGRPQSRHGQDPSRLPLARRCGR